MEVRMTTLCPVCKSGDAAPYAEQNGYHYVRCPGCSFVYLDPMPAQEDLNHMYESDGSIAADHYPKARSRRRRAVMKALSFRRYVKGRTVLDIGCGGGFMVDAMRIMGADAHGFDVSTGAIAYASKHFPACHFFCASYDQLLAHEGRYGFIYSSEVIEHVNDLDAYIDMLKRMTIDGGYVYLTTPDIGSRHVPEEITEWDVFTPPIHVQFFDETTLTLAMAAFDFAPVKRYADKKSGLKMLFQKR